MQVLTTAPLSPQVRDGSEVGWLQAARALSLLVLRSPLHRVQATQELVTLLSVSSERVRHRAAEALRLMGEASANEPRLSIAQMGGVERFVTMLAHGSIEAQERILRL